MATRIHDPARNPAGVSGVPPTVKGLSLVSLFNDFASEMVYPLLPAFVTRTLGGGALVLGVLDGASELTSSVVKWVSGRLADRPGWRRPLILSGLCHGGAGAAPYRRGQRRLAGRGISGDRPGRQRPRTPPRDALIAEITPPPLRGRAFGFHRGGRPLRCRARLARRLVPPESRGRRPERHRLERGARCGGVCGAGGGVEGSWESGAGS